MDVWDATLTLHIAAGASGLALGPLAMRAAKRRGRHTRLAAADHTAMGAVCLSAAALALLAWHRLWWFLPIAAFSYANALVGYVAAKRRGRGWLIAHIGGMGGSYIALTTALLVINLGREVPLAWVLPTLVGTPIIVWVINEVAAGRRPRRVPRRPEQDSNLRPVA